MVLADPRDSVAKASGKVRTRLSRRSRG
jgi:hypothetical protein